MNFFTASIQNTQSSDLWFTIKYIIVATLFIYLLWMFSRFLTKKNHIALKGRRVKIVERVPLSNDKSLILVELGNIFYLIAVHKTGIVLLDTRTDLPDLSDAVSEPDFLDRLKTALNHQKTSDKDTKNE
ncbi:MAG: Flagellar biosynthesis protein FliO [Clostridiales bacterium]|jgi:flagellar biogenesis protein FliO|nr:Flagellar biosynthesis protein FliO [Clostridiales bacterium]